ncbi:hypothetical protein NCCP2495_29820 [Dietzia sp. NCCP-2495]|uniref:hypothetical protein n=1 Tax=Dietzia sp. NCCP-2495 TaxID=2934675 RepID=UPI00222FFD48|nr:hypothetical protein [Dietzia sp. NCCP-2495]GLB65102.1 hypothetical protein NCCP2495_29820 [Dietzia sp. NCCP-2495]
MRRVLAWFSAVVVTLGVATVPSVATAQPTRSTTSFDTTCHISAPKVAGVGGPMDITPKNPVQIHVTAPESVNAGERFDVTFEIDPINVELDSLPSAISLKRASRLKLDLQRPAGTKLVDYSFSGGNIPIADGRVITVNENGVPDANGTVLRLTDKGHNTIGNGGNTSTTSHAGLNMDLSGKTALDFQFPKVTLTFEAERAGTANIGVRTQGAAATYGANPASYLTLLASAGVPLLGDQWVPGYCSPRSSATAPINGGAATMKSVEIVGLPTSSTLTAPDQVLLRAPAEFVTTVDPRIAGEVTFTSGNQRVTAQVDTATGEARARLTFNDPAEAVVTSRFTPTDPRYATATSEIRVTPERLPTQMTITAPASTEANTRTPISVSLPGDARGTVTFTSGDQVREVAVRDGQAATSITFSQPGETEVEAVFTPSATSAYGTATASATILVEESTNTSLILNGLDAPGYVAEPARLEAVINPAEGTTDPQGRVEFVAGAETQIVDVVDGKAAAEFTFGRPGDVEVSATFHPAGSDQTRATDSGTLEILDAEATGSDLVGPATVEPGQATEYRIVTTPAGVEGTAVVRIDGRVVATDVEINDGEGHVTLTFPPAVQESRTVTVEFTPQDPRMQRPHTVEHTIRVASAAVDEDALTVTVEGPAGDLEAGQAGRFRVTVLPTDELASPATLNGYLTVTNNGEPVLDEAGEPVRIPVTRGVADTDITWTSGYPQAKFLQFTYHSPGGAERASGSITVNVIGEGDGADGVSVTPGQGTGGSGSLDLGSLTGSGSLSGSLGG